ncbi:hypothetical protein ACFQZT_33895 [Paenibacillus sp. GCM10027628]|uniref:hypothetical protein n=1 Tax=Paenibacillus sp. GCM10027628 TaxID=3273413 RepID=UPI00363B70B0
MNISSSSTYTPYTYSSPFISSSSYSSNNSANSDTTNTVTSIISTTNQNQTVSGNIINPYVYSNPYANSPFSQQTNSDSSATPNSDQFDSQINSGIVSSMMSGSNSSLTSGTLDTSWMNSFDQLSSMTSNEFTYMNNNPTSPSGQNVLYTTNLMQTAYSQASQLLSNNTSGGQLINQLA